MWNVECGTLSMIQNGLDTQFGKMIEFFRNEFEKIR